MDEHDHKRLAALISRFIEEADFTPPFHLVSIGSNGSVSVSLCKENGTCVELCKHGPSITSPVVVSLLSLDGRGRSARIEIEAARLPTLQ